MTKEGLKHRLSETILKFGRGMSCVNSQALSEDKDYEPLGKQSKIGTEREQQQHSECLREDKERELLDTFQPHRIRRSISFTGFGIHDVQHLRSIPEGYGARKEISRPDSILSEPRRSRCHSFAGVKNKTLVKITRGSNGQTAVIDGLLTTTFCSTDL